MHPRKACLRGRGEGYWDELLREIQPNLSGCYSENKVVISCVRPLLETYVQAACVCRMCMLLLFLLLGSGHEAGDDAVAKG